MYTVFGPPGSISSEIIGMGLKAEVLGVETKFVMTQVGGSETKFVMTQVGDIIFNRTPNFWKSYA